MAWANISGSCRFRFQQGAVTVVSLQHGTCRQPLITTSLLLLPLEGWPRSTQYTSTCVTATSMCPSVSYVNFVQLLPQLIVKALIPLGCALSCLLCYCCYSTVVCFAVPSCKSCTCVSISEFTLQYFSFLCVFLGFHSVLSLPYVHQLINFLITLCTSVWHSITHTLALHLAWHNYKSLWHTALTVAEYPTPSN